MLEKQRKKKKYFAVKSTVFYKDEELLSYSRVENSIIDIGSLGCESRENGEVEPYILQKIITLRYVPYTFLLSQPLCIIFFLTFFLDRICRTLIFVKHSKKKCISDSPSEKLLAPEYHLLQILFEKKYMSSEMIYIL